MSGALGARICPVGSAPMRLSAKSAKAPHNLPGMRFGMLQDLGLVPPPASWPSRRCQVTLSENGVALDATPFSRRPEEECLQASGIR
jgi:hypothetical protein